MLAYSIHTFIWGYIEHFGGGRGGQRPYGWISDIYHIRDIDFAYSSASR